MDFNEYAAEAVGQVSFGPDGEWAKSRILMVQFQGITDNSLEQFARAGTRVVLYPPDWRSGTLRAPYAAARK